MDERNDSSQEGGVQTFLFSGAKRANDGRRQSISLATVLTSKRSRRGDDRGKIDFVTDEELVENARQFMEVEHHFDAIHNAIRSSRERDESLDARLTALETARQ
jgi:hypothetical protein